MPITRWPLDPKAPRVNIGGVITRGLVGYWKLDDQGAIVYDSSGLGNNGAYHGTTLSSNIPPVKFPDLYSRVFNGASDYATIPSTPFTQAGNSSFTLTCRLKTKTAVLSQAVVGKQDWATGKGEYIIFFRATGNIAFGISNSAGGNTTVDGGAGVNNSAWHLVVAVQDVVNNRIGISVDGGAFTYLARTVVCMANNTPLNIGAASNPVTNFFNGSIDEVRKYNRLLSVSEVTLMAAGIG